MGDPVQRHDDDRSLGQRIADACAAAVGSWPFIIGQAVLLALWIVANGWWLAHRAFDPPPFILLNLLLSFQAAFTGPILLLSQNRQAARDRDLAQHDFAINAQAEGEMRSALKHLDDQEALILEVLKRLEERESWRCSGGKTE